MASFYKLCAALVLLFFTLPYILRFIASFFYIRIMTPKACANCKKAATDCGLANLQQCSKCKTTEYCGRDCQKADWKTHKKICAQQANANANSGFPPNTTHSTNYSAPRLKTLEKHVPNPFTRLDDGKYLHDRLEKDVYRLLIDAFRMRSEDDMRLENKPTPHSIYTDKPSSIEPFKKFLDQAEQRSGLLPPWWDAEHRAECEKFAESGEWNDVRKKVTKAQMIAHYGDDKAPMQLRMLAEAVYGAGSMGQDGTGMRRVLRSMESGGPGDGKVMSMMDVSNLMGGHR